MDLLLEILADRVQEHPLVVSGVISAFGLALYLFTNGQRGHANTKLRKSYDYIVVGGGSAGAIVAARLSEDESKYVLLIEAGGVPTSESFVPGNPARLQLNERYDWRYKSYDAVHGRTSFWPRGRVLGGSSILNYMLYVVGNKRDYDGWAELGCEGWSHDEVLPYFKAIETYVSDMGSEYRGNDGPIHVESYHDKAVELTKLIIQAAGESGCYVNPDYNGETQEGISISQFNIKNGVRQSTQNTYILEAESRPNLHILTEAQVTKVNIDGDKANGVTFQRTPFSMVRNVFGIPQADPSPPEIVNCHGEVILSAGAVGSPHILMLSGIGNKSHLEEHGIECVVDLPGVGQNLRDHILVFDIYNTTKPLGMNLKTTWKLLALLQMQFGKGPAISSALEGTGFFRTKPEYDRPDLQIHVFPGVITEEIIEKTNSSLSPMESEDGYMLCPTLLHPKSIGSITITSSDPFIHPKIDANYLAHEDDFQTLIEGFKLAKKITSEKTLKDITKSHFVDEEIPYPSDSEEYIREYIQKYFLTVYHPVGTCKMGVDELSVVDPRLRVYGVQNLRVIDASIMPTLVSGNTNAPSMMVGEKGAALIKEDYVTPKL